MMQPTYAVPNRNAYALFTKELYISGYSYLAAYFKWYIYLLLAIRVKLFYIKLYVTNLNVL